jgi:hypothetical protein
MIVYVTSLTVGGNKVTFTNETPFGAAEATRQHLDATEEDLRADICRQMIIQHSPINPYTHPEYVERRIQSCKAGVLRYLGSWLEGNDVKRVYNAGGIHLEIEQTFLKP